MAGSTRLENPVNDVASRWLGRVGPQLGTSADFAQVDIDTLVPIKGALKKELATFSVALFQTIITNPEVLAHGWFAELSIPISEDIVLPAVTADTDAASLLSLARFTGSLRGRPVPGIFLSTWVPSDRTGPAWQRRIRLRPDSASRASIHFREEGWIEDIGDGRTDTWSERALEYRNYPPEPMYREAVFP